jgi:hypothetical protein
VCLNLGTLYNFDTCFEVKVAKLHISYPQIYHSLVQMTDYTVPGGKLNRGLSVIDSLRLLNEGGLTEQEEFQACALGWCIEWVSRRHDFSRPSRLFLVILLLSSLPNLNRKAKQAG